jgi:hypothetical protein
MGNTRPAPNAVSVKVVIRSELKNVVLFNLYVDNVTHESAIRQNRAEDWLDRLRLQREHDEVLHRQNGLPPKSLRLPL